jgi:hypothetical protein
MVWKKLKHSRERPLDERDLLLDGLDGLVDVALLHVIHVLHLQAHQLVRYLHVQKRIYNWRNEILFLLSLL